MTCIKSEKSSKIYTSKYKSSRIYTSLDVSTEMIPAAMEKGQDDTCEVLGQNSTASLTGCGFNFVASVYDVL